ELGLALYPCEPSRHHHPAPAPDDGDQERGVLRQRASAREVSRRRREQRLEGREQLFRTGAWRGRQRGGESAVQAAHRALPEVRVRRRKPDGGSRCAGRDRRYADRSRRSAPHGAAQLLASLCAQSASLWRTAVSLLPENGALAKLGAGAADPWL